MRNGDKVVEVRFPITASAIAAVVIIVLTICYYLASDSIKDTIVFIAASCAAAGAILAAFYSARGLELSTRGMVNAIGASERETAVRRRHYAMRFAERWNDAAMFHMRDIIRELFELVPDSPEFAQLGRERKTNVIHCLNFLEEIALAIKSGDADEDILKDAFRGAVLEASTKLQNWIREQRVSRGRPRVWCELEELARKWAA